MAELVKVFNGMFRGGWNKVTDIDKTECFFIFNRFFSKKYTSQSIILNNKNIDKVMAMDIWYEFMKTQPYPSWFWSKSEKSEKEKVTNKEFLILKKRFNLKDDDIKYLIDKYFDIIKEELDFIKKLEKL